jgi:hypothetical protein
MSNYEHPPLNQYALWNRRVEGEEQHNNVINVAESLRELDTAATHLIDTGVPLKQTVDDLDHDTLFTEDLTWDMMDVIYHAVTKEKAYLERQGVVFDPKWESVAYWRDEGGDVK